MVRADDLTLLELPLLGLAEGRTAMPAGIMEGAYTTFFIASNND